MDLKTFNTAANEVRKIARLGIDFEPFINSNGYKTYSFGKCNAPILPYAMQFKDCAAISGFWDLYQRNTIEHSVLSYDISFEYNNCISNMGVIGKNVPTMKFFPDIDKDYLPYFTGYIDTAPFEATTKGKTYRLLCDEEYIYACVPHTDNLYDYLDQGHFITHIIEVVKNSGKYTNTNQDATKNIHRYIVSPVMDLDTVLAIACVRINPKLIKHFVKGCWIPRNKSKLIRAMCEKGLSTKQRKGYKVVKILILESFMKNGNRVVSQKLKDGEVETATFNDVVFTRTSASYETIDIRSDDFLDVVTSRLNLTDQFDIYDVVRSYVEEKVSVFESELASDDLLKGYTEVELERRHRTYGHDHIISREYRSEFDRQELENNRIRETNDARWGRSANIKVTINNIPIVVSLKGVTRQVNGISIRKDELSKVMFRASCHNDVDSYNDFLKSVKRMSLEYHDILANGLGVKIHTPMTYEEYRDPKPSLRAPKLMFRKKGIKYYLVLPNDDEVMINLRKTINKVNTLNRRTTCGYNRKSYTSYDERWCAHELQIFLGNSAIELNIHNGEILSDEEVVERRRQLELVAEQVKRDHVEALRKSELFLADIVKKTKTKETTLNGEKAYLVKGSIRNYIVVHENGKVFDEETGRYICIVDSNHEHGVGKDAVGARILALKNDTKLVDRITTLK